MHADVLANLKDMVDEDLMVLITNRTPRLYHYNGRKLQIDLSKVGF
jgi:hypothetical protein